MKAEKDVVDKELNLQQQKLALPDLSFVSTCVWISTEVSPIWATDYLF